MPLITKVRQAEPVQSQELEKVTKRFSVRWILDVKGIDPAPYTNGAPDHKAVVVEDPPRMVPISFRHGKTYRIWKPWSYIIGHFTPQGGYLKSSIFFSYEKLKSEKERSLLLVPLTNITYTRLYYVRPCVCIGEGVVSGHSLESRAIRLNDMFWGSSFNSEIRVGTGAKPHWTKGRNLALFMEEWEQRSADEKRRPKITFREAASRMSSVSAATRWLRAFI